MTCSGPFNSALSRCSLPQSPSATPERIGTYKDGTWCFCGPFFKLQVCCLFLSSLAGNSDNFLSQSSGLLSLAVGFARVDRFPCLNEDSSNYTQPFTSGADAHCHQHCHGRTTGIRLDPQNPSQYVLDMHRGITINTALGLSVGLCIPAILSLVTIWFKLMREKLAASVEAIGKFFSSWNDGASSVGEDNMQAASSDQIQRREHDMSEDQMRGDQEKKMDAVIRIGLGLVERVVFTSLIIAIVVLGERNFWSAEMRAGVEPMSSVGE